MPASLRAKVSPCLCRIGHGHTFPRTLSLGCRRKHFVPLPKLPLVKEMAQLMIQHAFQVHDHSEDVVFNRGPQFSSAFWREFYKLLGATISQSSGSAWTNSQVEWVSQYLWCMTLVWKDYARNSLVSLATGLSSFLYLYGYQPTLFLALSAYIHRCRRMGAWAQAHLLHTGCHYVASANHQQTSAPSYRVGQEVWLSTLDLPVQVKS